MKLRSILIVACIGMMFAACSSRDDYSAGTEKQPIKINASIKGMQTRSTDASKLQNTDFLEGAEINVWLSNYVNGNDIPGIPAGLGYVTYKKESTGWETTTQLFWDEVALDAFGIYPAKDANSTPITKSTTSFSVQEEQDNDENYRKSDLMYAYKFFSNKGTPIPLEFTHCLSKVTVIVDPTDLHDLADFKANFDFVEIINITRDASLTITNSSVTATGTGSTTNSSTNYVTLGDRAGAEALCSTGVSCIIPPQFVDGGKSLFNIVYNIDFSYTYSVPSGGINFQAGKEYIFKLSLGQTEATLAAPTIKGWTQVNQEESGVAY